MIRMRSVAALLGITFALTACGGGGGKSVLGSVPGGPGTTGRGSSGNVQFKLTIPAANSTSSSARRGAQTVSSQTESISVTVNGGTPQVFNVTSSTCTGTAPIVCTLSVGAPYGIDGFLILTYSGQNATGTALNAAAFTLNVTAGGTNSATVTAGNLLVVNSNADGSGGSYSCASGSTTCTLREAVAEASTTTGVVTAIMFQGVTSITVSSVIEIGNGGNQNIIVLGPGATAANTSGAGAPSASSGLTISGGNSSGIFYVDSGSSFVVDGLTLENGNSTTDSVGGAIENYGALSIVNTAFSGNNGGPNYSGGGAVYDDSTTTSSILASTFANNVAEYGGAYYIEDNSGGGANFSHCLFTNNTAFYASDDYGEGGAIYGGWNLSVDSSTFTGNIAGSKTVSGIEGEGGAISMEYNGVAPSITNSTFGGSSASLGNFAGGPGPSDDGYGGAIYDDGDYPMTFSGNTFSSNVVKGGDEAEGSAVYDYLGINSTGDTFSNNVSDTTAGTATYSYADGAVYTDAISTFANDAFTSNQVNAINTSEYGDAWGGGLDAEGDSVTVTQSTFTGNVINGGEECYGGGGAYVYNDEGYAATFTNVQFTNNSCTATFTSSYPYAFGGGLRVDFGTIALSNVTFSGNTASALGNATNYGDAYGGGFEYCGSSCYPEGDDSVKHRFAPNSRAFQAKVVANRLARRTQTYAKAQSRKTALLTRRRAKISKGVAVKTAPSFVHAGSTRRAQSGSAMSLSSVTFTGNTANGGTGGDAYGGGADIAGGLTFSGVSFSGNTATASSTGYGAGGGLSVGGWDCDSGMTFTATVSGNSATNSGGGIVNFCSAFIVASSAISGNSITAVAYDGDGGGGIANYYGSMQLTQSTITANTVAGSIAGAGGGGVMNYDGSLTVTNSTIFANTSSVDGGGLENGVGCCSAGTVYLTNVTIYQNTATGKGGSVDNQNNSGSNYVYLVNTILAGGTASSGAEVNNLDTFVSYGGNLIQGSVTGNSIPAATGGGIADLLGVSPALASGLASNGGTTQTIADTGSSPGRGHVPYASGQCGYNGPNVDQRGYSRGAGGVCDIGAYEFAGNAP